jgi:peptidoglycan L-alanyl-D-glutamate endopeptidase CwlK
MSTVGEIAKSEFKPPSSRPGLIVSGDIPEVGTSSVILVPDSNETPYQTNAFSHEPTDTILSIIDIMRPTINSGYIMTSGAKMIISQVNPSAVTSQNLQPATDEKFITALKVQEDASLNSLQQSYGNAIQKATVNLTSGTLELNSKIQSKQFEWASFAVGGQNLYSAGAPKTIEEYQFIAEKTMAQFNATSNSVSAETKNIKAANSTGVLQSTTGQALDNSGNAGSTIDSNETQKLLAEKMSLSPDDIDVQYALTTNEISSINNKSNMPEVMNKADSESRAILIQVRRLYKQRQATLESINILQSRITLITNEIKNRQTGGGGLDDANKVADSNSLEIAKALAATAAVSGAAEGDALAAKQRTDAATKASAAAQGTSSASTAPPAVASPKITATTAPSITTSAAAAGSNTNVSKQATTTPLPKTNNFTAPAQPDIDGRSQRNIDGLIPPLQKLAAQHYRAMISAGLQVRIISGYRSIEDQEAIYAQGRTTTGNIVTNAKGGHSYHNYGLAYDIGIFENNYKVYVAEKRRLDDRYSQAANLAPAGLNWGGNLSSPDRPHYQFPAGIGYIASINPMLALRAQASLKV